jgi:protein-disulfide isomerase
MTSTPGGNTIPVPVPRGATPDGDGIVVGSGPVVVDAYIDFQCPFCRQFEENAGPTLDAMVVSRQISLVHHPMNFLDAASTNHYSTRAAASSGCASDGGRFNEYAHALFANQPPEGGPGLSDEQLIELGTLVGLPAAEFGRCVTSGKYLEWPSYVTELAIARGVNATPTVFVQGTPVPANPVMIAAAVRGTVPA